MSYRANSRDVCASCERPYIRDKADGWWHFEKYRGPAPFQGPQAKNPSFTGSMCGPCADKHIYASQSTFEAFVKLKQVTEKLTT